jgi:hypothetical protein
MAAEKINLNALKDLLIKSKIATLDELKSVLKTKSTMTIFRKLKQLDYISSYSHRGKYYSLHEIADYNFYGIWSHQSVWFSQYGNLVETAKDLIDNSAAGYSAKELETIVHVIVQNSAMFWSISLPRKRKIKARGLHVKIYVNRCISICLVK